MYGESWASTKISFLDNTYNSRKWSINRSSGIARSKLYLRHLRAAFVRGLEVPLEVRYDVPVCIASSRRFRSAEEPLSSCPRLTTVDGLTDRSVKLGFFAHLSVDVSERPLSSQRTLRSICFRLVKSSGRSSRPGRFPYSRRIGDFFLPSVSLSFSRGSATDPRLSRGLILTRKPCRPLVKERSRTRAHAQFIHRFPFHGTVIVAAIKD